MNAKRAALVPVCLLVLAPGSLPARALEPVSAPAQQAKAVQAVEATPAGAEHAKPVPPGLSAGDTLAFCGDSITHQTLYTRYVALFYHTRYPHTRVRVFNAGVGGNSALGALRRFRHDILEQKPTVVAVLFGMNDGGYKAFDEETFAKYQANMTTILDRLRDEAKAQAILLTPTMYDYELRARKRPTSKLTFDGYNQVLIRYGDWCKQTAKERKLMAIDLNAPMVAVTQELRKKDPQATLSRDGIHPAAPGHWVMTHAILKGFGVTPTVSAVRVDAAAGRTQCERATLTNLQAGPTGVRFDLLAEALPMPYPDEVKKVLEIVPFTRDLNQETLQVTGLRAGRYKLAIDGQAVGAYTAAQLAAGVNLATNAATPQHKQAVQVWKLGLELQKEVLRERRFRLMEKKKGYKNLDGTYPRKGLKRAKGPDGKDQWVTDEEWERKFAEEAKKYPAILERLAALRDKVYQTNQPTRHHYELTPATQQAEQ